MSYMPKYRIYNTYLCKKEGVIIFADCERDFLLSARRSYVEFLDKCILCGALRKVSFNSLFHSRLDKPFVVTII